MTKKFFIITGEASGDLLGAKIIKEIKTHFPNQKLEFVGVGGEMMEKEGFTSIFDINELSIMGFVEVVPHIFKILRRIKQVSREIIKQNPDYVITIDAPDFNFRVIKKIAHLKNIKKIHIIAPSVWAYREKRAQKIAKLYDLLLVILPFEPPYFTKYGLKTEFIGHFIVENEPDFSKKEISRMNFRQKYGFYNNDTIIYMTPGSRVSEVKKIFPEFILAINNLKEKVENLSVVIPIIEKTKDLVEKMALDFEVKYVLIKKEEKEDALFSCDFALAKSGTNTVEISLYKLPMLICYKVNFISYLIARLLVKIKFANLLNLIMSKMIIPELLQKNCYHKVIEKNLEFLIKNPEIAKKQIDESYVALKSLGLGFEEKPSKKAVDEILKL